MGLIWFVFALISVTVSGQEGNGDVEILNGDFDEEYADYNGGKSAKLIASRAVDPEIVPCNSEHDQNRAPLLETSKCGEPKDFFFNFDRLAYQELSPRGIWVKRCLGSCEYDKDPGYCVPTGTTKRRVAIRIYDAKTNKESCAYETVVDHASCSCCGGLPRHCEPPRVYNRKRCICQCPDKKAKKACFASEDMKWDRLTCQCMEKYPET